MLEEVANNDVALQQAIERVRPASSAIGGNPFPADHIGRLFDRESASIIAAPNSGNTWQHAPPRARALLRGPYVAPEIAAAAHQLLQPIFVHDSGRELTGGAACARRMVEELANDDVAL